MKIAEVTPFFRPVEGGVEQHVLNVSKTLVSLGNEVQVLTTKSHHFGRLDALEEEEIDGLRVFRFEAKIPLGAYARFWPGLIDYLRRERFDVIHSHVYRHPHSDISCFLGHNQGSKCILTAHSPFYPASVRGLFQHLLVEVYDKTVSTLLLGRYDAVIAVTALEKQKLISLGSPRQRTYLIPNGVEECHFRESDPKEFLDKYGIDRDYVLFLGRLAKTKGLEFILSALRLVRDERSDLLFVIAGEGGEYQSFLRRVATELGLSTNVIFTGSLSAEMKMKAFSGCQLFVLPSIYEGFGMVILEAMAHGKPVIATRSGDPANLIEDGESGFHTDFGDCNDFASKLTRIIEDEKLSKRMGSKGMEIAKNYLWSDIADRIEDVYIRIL